MTSASVTDFTVRKDSSGIIEAFKKKSAEQTWGTVWKNGEDDCKDTQVTYRWGIEKHTCHTNNTLALCAWQAGHLCLGNLGLWYSKAPCRSCLRLLPCSGKDQSPVVKWHHSTPVNPWSHMETAAPATLWHGANSMVPVSLPVCHCPGAAWGIPQLVRLTKINSHFAFHLWLCVCSCVLSIPTHSHCFSLLLVVGGQVKDVKLWLKGVKRAIATPKAELMSNIQRKGGVRKEKEVVREWSRKKGWE